MEDQNPFLQKEPTLADLQEMHTGIPQAQEKAMTHAAVNDSNPFLKGNSQVLLNAEKGIGREDYNGLCEKFAEQVSYGKTGLFRTASDAWDNYVQNGQARPDTQNAPMGSLIYFDNNSPYGHVAITDGRGNITGATDNGVKTMPMDQWVKETNQKVLGFVTP